ncbi:MAG: hypothetical protein ABJD97_22730, partial [Betaproteobacteria bacterium]
MSRDFSKTLAWVVLAGVVGATFDITYAILYYGWRGIGAERIFHTIASGLLGKAAFDGGLPVAALGLALHYGIVIVAAAIFLAAARRIAWLHEEPIVAGALFGLCIYGFMNFVVLPLSAYPFKQQFPLLTTATGLLVHMFLIGVPIA